MLYKWYSNRNGLVFRHMKSCIHHGLIIEEAFLLIAIFLLILANLMLSLSHPYIERQSMNKISSFILTFMGCLMICSCNSRNSKQYVIGVSQCSEDIWRDKLNQELRTATYMEDGVTMRFTSADDNDKRQIQQIEQFIKDGVDLLIISPNQAHAITPVVDKAVEKGIPVILFDRKTDGKYTAFIGADNVEVGRQMGDYVARQLDYHGRVIELMGLKGSSPAIERHRGFIERISRYPGIKLVESLQGDWTKASGRRAIQAFSQRHGTASCATIACVFAQNDRMAMGAREAGLLPKSTLFCGVDALPGEQGGMKLVADSVLSASYIYPTRGDLVMKLAMNILNHRPYQKENLLQSALVTPDKAPLMLMQADEMNMQQQRIQSLHERLDTFFMRYNHQKVYLLLTLIILVLFVGIFFYVYRMALYRHRMTEKSITEKLHHYMQLHEQRAQLERHLRLANVPQPDEVLDNDTVFMNKLFECIIKNLANSEFNVEMLASQLDMSRVQLYRKVKSVTESSPVEIIRITRLQQADRLLKQGGMNVSEVSYRVGFSSPSYFSKCYKEQFGHVPTASNGHAKALDEPNA